MLFIWEVRFSFNKNFPEPSFNRKSNQKGPFPLIVNFMKREKIWGTLYYRFLRINFISNDSNNIRDEPTLQAFMSCHPCSTWSIDVLLYFPNSKSTKLIGNTQWQNWWSFTDRWNIKLNVLSSRWQIRSTKKEA